MSGHTEILYPREYCIGDIVPMGVKVVVSTASSSSVLFKRLHPDAIIPKKQRIGDAGFDLHSAFSGIIHAGSRLAVRTNVAVAIPSGYVGLIKGRSGLATKHGIAVLGGVIDENYRGELVVLLHNTGSQNFYFKVDDRIAQLVIVPVCPFESVVVDELPENQYRGVEGFGSSGV